MADRRVALRRAGAFFAGAFFAEAAALRVVAPRPLDFLEVAAVRVLLDLAAGLAAGAAATGAVLALAADSALTEASSVAMRATRPSSSLVDA